MSIYQKYKLVKTFLFEIEVNTLLEILENLTWLDNRSQYDQ